MATMPKQKLPGLTGPAINGWSHEEIQIAFKTHFPWMGQDLAKPVESNEPEQRGFIIGGVRL